jgi:hypothetical protein
MSVSVQLMSGETFSFDLCNLSLEKPSISDLAREVSNVLSYKNIGIRLSYLEHRVVLSIFSEGEYIELDHDEILEEGKYYYGFVKESKYQNVLLLLEDGEVVLKSEDGKLLEKYGFNNEGLSFNPDRPIVLLSALSKFSEASDVMRRNLIEAAKDNDEEDDIDLIKGYKDAYIFWIFYGKFIQMKTQDIRFLE